MLILKWNFSLQIYLEMFGVYFPELWILEW